MTDKPLVLEGKLHMREQDRRIEQLLEEVRRLTTELTATRSEFINAIKSAEALEKDLLRVAAERDDALRLDHTG